MRPTGTIQLPRELSADDVRSLSNKYSNFNWDGFLETIGESIRGNGFLTRAEFLDICRWSTPRSMPLFSKNSEETIIQQTKIALSAETMERQRMESLRKLQGVNWVTASVILCIGHTDPYPILDCQVLWALGIDGIPDFMSFEYWNAYVQNCRALARQLNVSMRELNYALRQYTKDNHLTSTFSSASQSLVHSGRAL